MKRYLIVIISLFALLFGTSLSLLAQSTDATIRGTVVDEQGDPLPGATVRVENESTGFNTGTSTNVNGAFTIRQLPLGGPYNVTVSFVGFSSDVRSDIELNLGDRLNLEFALREQAGMLDDVVVSAGLQNRVARFGSTTEISSREISSLPVQDRNFTNLADLSPLKGRSGSIAGARRIGTNFTIDGMNARGNRTGGEQGRGPFSVSIEAIREFEVQTNNYDVTIGRQSGGGINAATKSGTNQLEISTFGYLRHNELTANTDFIGNPIDDQFSNAQFGFTAGGPIVEDRAHFFVAYDRQQAQRPIDVINLGSDDDMIANRISNTNMNRLLDIASNSYGLASPNDQIGLFTQDGVQDALFTRFDWQLNDQNRLTLVNNYTKFTSDFVSGGDQLAIRESRPNRYSLVNTTNLSLRSSFSDNFMNVFQLQFNISDDEARQDIGIVPRIFVQTESELPNGSVGRRDIQLGGHRWSPNYSNERNFHIKNTSYLSTDNVTYTFGADMIAGYHDVWISSTQFGLFEFDSIDAFEAMQPFRYSRLAPRDEVITGRDFWVLDGGVFGQAEFSPHRDIEMMAGLRYDLHYLLSEPPFNQDVLDRFGASSDHRPLDLTNLQPRFNVTWDLGGQGRDILKFGGGGFSSWNNYYSYITQFLYSGADLASVTLTGDDVPTPDFTSYRNDPSTIPGAPDGFEAPSLIAFSSEDAKTPYTWKGNISYNRFVTQNLRLGVNLLGSYTVNNYHYFDRNLRQFFSVDPDNRPVFVPAESISASGNTNYFDGRQFNEFEQVLEMVSEGKARQYGFILEGDYDFGRGARLSASYTWNKAEDNTPYNGNNAISALGTPVSGDPRQLEWAPSNDDFRHKLVVRGSLPEVYGFVLSGSYVGISGSPVNVSINRDIMGTSTSGDELAFIFDPNDPATPANIAQGMETVLNNPDNRFADYLQDNLGTRATRNAVRDQFTGIINLRLAREVQLPGFRAEFMLDVFNVGNMLNNEWGYTSTFGSRQTLLNVTGFDQDAQQYEYSVNENFGVKRQNGTPYQIQLGIRLSI